MAFTNPTAIDRSRIIALPVELQIKIYQNLDCLRTADRLRATCQHLHSVFQNNKTSITTAYREQILDLFERFYSIVEKFSTLPVEIGHPVPDWQTKMPFKTSFLESILKSMPFALERAIVGYRAHWDFMIPWGFYDRYDADLIGILMDDFRHKRTSANQVILTEHCNKILDVYTAKILVEGKSETIEEYLRRLLQTYINVGALSTYTLPRGF